MDALKNEDGNDFQLYREIIIMKKPGTKFKKNVKYKLLQCAFFPLPNLMQVPKSKIDSTVKKNNKKYEHFTLLSYKKILYIRNYATDGLLEWD